MFLSQSMKNTPYSEAYRQKMMDWLEGHDEGRARIEAQRKHRATSPTREDKVEEPDTRADREDDDGRIERTHRYLCEYHFEERTSKDSTRNGPKFFSQ